MQIKGQSLVFFHQDFEKILEVFYQDQSLAIKLRKFDIGNQCVFEYNNLITKLPDQMQQQYDVLNNFVSQLVRMFSEGKYFIENNRIMLIQQKQSRTNCSIRLKQTLLSKDIQLSLIIDKLKKCKGIQNVEQQIQFLNKQVLAYQIQCQDLKQERDQLAASHQQCKKIKQERDQLIYQRDRFLAYQVQCENLRIERDQLLILNKDLKKLFNQKSQNISLNKPQKNSTNKQQIIQMSQSNPMKVGYYAFWVDGGVQGDKKSFMQWFRQKRIELESFKLVKIIKNKNKAKIPIIQLLISDIQKIDGRQFEGKIIKLQKYEMN